MKLCLRIIQDKSHEHNFTYKQAMVEVCPNGKDDCAPCDREIIAAWHDVIVTRKLAMGD